MLADVNLWRLGFFGVFRFGSCFVFALANGMAPAIYIGPICFRFGFGFVFALAPALFLAYAIYI